MGGWLETDNRAISVQLNLTGTATGTELCKMHFCQDFGFSKLRTMLENGSLNCLPGKKIGSKNGYKSLTLKRHNWTGIPVR